MSLGRAPGVDIEVTEEIIEQSTRRSSSHCMIAEAIRSSFPLAKAVSVDIQTIRFTDPSKRERYIYLTPRVAQTSLVEFDQGKKPEPFIFRLRSGQTVSCDRTHSRNQKNPSKPQMRVPKGGTSNSTPEIVGGQPPPRVGGRREFGLRSFER